MRTGYECRRCGYQPNDDELHGGSCPNCAPVRLYEHQTLPARLDALPLGSSVQVLRKPRWGVTSYVEDTLYLWTKVEQNPDGSSVWCSKIGRTTFYDAGGDLCPVYVHAFAETRYHDPYRMTSQAVAHFTVGEMTYGARYVLHDPTPKPLTDKDITRMVFLEDMGWHAAA